MLCGKINFLIGSVLLSAGTAGTLHSSILLTVHCGGDESSIFECAQQQMNGGGVCARQNYLAVQCHNGKVYFVVTMIAFFSPSLYEDTDSTISVCDHGDMQLVGGSSIQEGRVEVCYNGLWAAVCSSGWNFINARVICSRLGQGTTFLRLRLLTAIRGFIQ